MKFYHRISLEIVRFMRLTLIFINRFLVNVFERRIVIIICIIVTFWAAIFSNAEEVYSLLEQPDIEPKPIIEGEVLVYSAKIGIFPFSAGKQILEVVGETEISGHRVYHLRAVAETNGIFSKIYNFRNHEESYVTKKQFYPVLYTKKIHDRGYKANYRVTFDLKGKVNIVKNDKKKELCISSGIQDELSMIYFIRTKKLDIGKKYKFPVLIGTKIYKAVLEVVRRESRRTDIGKVDTLVLETTNGYKLWLTDNNLRIPVRIEVKTKIGTLIAELEEMYY